MPESIKNLQNHSICSVLADGYFLWKFFESFNFNFSAYVMVPYSSHYTPQHSIHVQPQLPTPTPTVYTYSHGLSSSHHQPAYQSVKSLEYNVPATSVTPLQTSVDYKNNAPITIVPKKTLPSIATTSFQQYYSPGLEYHYTEAVPITKLSPHSAFSYQHVPTHSNYAQANYVSQAPSFSYYHAGPSSMPSNYNKHQSSGLLDSYVPSLMTFGRQQQNQYKNYYPTPYLQNQHYPQHLFTPSQPSSSYAPFPSPQAYNTIQYSVSLPPYPEHSKRSTSKATATLNVKAPKTNWIDATLILRKHITQWIYLFCIIFCLLIMLLPSSMSKRIE